MSKRLPLSAAVLGEKRQVQTEDNPVIIALQVCGALPENLDDCRTYLPGQHQNLAYPGEALIRLYPWLCETLLCPWCADEIQGEKIVSHPFEAHVRCSEISQEEEAEWIEEMESDVECDDEEQRHYARAVYFRDDDECAEVLQAARRHGLTVNAFLAAAARFLLRYPDLSLAGFAYPDPPHPRHVQAGNFQQDSR